MSKIKEYIMDKYQLDRIKLLEETRKQLIDCLRVALFLLPGIEDNKEAITYIKKVIDREELNNESNTRDFGN